MTVLPSKQQVEHAHHKHTHTYVCTDIYSSMPDYTDDLMS